jgi:hypothetical protein
MSLSEKVRPLLAARAATDPNAAKLLEMFTKADEILSERTPGADRKCQNTHTRASAIGIATETSPSHSLTRPERF